MIRLLIIDGMNLLRRIYSALPAGDNQEPDIAQFLTASTNALKNIIQRHQPSHAVCVLEHYASTWRHELYPPYKANRKPQPRAMLDAFPQLREDFARQGISWLDVEGYEADDIIASIVQTTLNHPCQNLILTTDQLMAQLLDGQTRIYDHFKQQLIDNSSIQDRLGIRPDQLVDYYALAGSSSVNIPGVTGIGAKTARMLLQEHGDCDTLLQARELPARVANRLSGAAPAIYLYRALFRLRRDCPIHGNIKEWRIATEH